MCICKQLRHRIFVGCRDKSTHKKSTFGIIVPDCLVQLCACTQKNVCAMKIKKWEIIERDVFSVLMYK